MHLVSVVVALAALVLAPGCSGEGPALTDGGGADGAGRDGGALDRGARDQAAGSDVGRPLAWAVSAGGAQGERGRGIAVDGQGNSHVTGAFQGTATFGGAALTNKGGSGDIFVARLDDKGAFSAAVAAGGAGANNGVAIAVDGAGNSYVAGNFTGVATFGSKTLTSSGGTEIFVAKVDQSGKIVSVVTAGGAQFDDGRAIAVDGAGNCYITGYFTGPATFGSTTLTSRGKWDVFVARLDKSGAFAWAVSAGGTEYEEGNAIAVDGAGSCHVAGTFRGAATFGSKKLTSRGEGDLFVARLDGSGSFVAAVSAGGTGDDHAAAVAVDGAGKVHVTGAFSGAATFGGQTLGSRGGTDIFVARLDGSGSFVAAVSAGGAGADQGHAIAVDGAGHSHVTGAFSGAATFGGATLVSRGLEDIFVARVDGGGKLVSAVAAGGTGSDAGQGIALDGAGGAYVTGAFSGAAAFGGKTLTSRGSTDVFVLKLD